MKCVILFMILLLVVCASYVTHSSIGGFRIASADTTHCATAEVFYDLNGTFEDGTNKDFDLDVDTGVITYSGRSNKKFIFHGSSNIKAGKACIITYTMKKNNIEDDSITTPATFPNGSTYKNLSIVRQVILNDNDKINIAMKSDTDNTTVTVENLNIVVIAMTGLK